MNRTSLFAALIVTAAVVLAVFSLWDDTYVVDEVPHLAAGYSYLSKQDMRLNPEHPPLAKIVGASPLFLFDAEDVFTDSPLWLNNTHFSQWELGRRLLFGSGIDPDAALRMIKSVMLLFLVGAAWVLYRWTYRRYGDHAALLAVGLFAFSPTVIGHSRLVATDIPALFGALLGCYLFARYIREPSRRGFWFWVAGLGVALLTKFSTIILLPVFVLVALIYAPRQLLPRTMLGIVLAFVLVVWPVYAILSSNYPPAQQVADTHRNLPHPSRQNIIERTIADYADHDLLRPLDYYALGLHRATERSDGGNVIFFRGDIVQDGPRWYFPFVYFIKEPLALWFLALIALIGCIKTVFKNRWYNDSPSRLLAWLRSNPDDLVMLTFLVAYWAVSIRSNLHIGLRHILPVYPFMLMFIAGGVVACMQRADMRVLRVVVPLLIAWYGAASVFSFPHYISYFNITVGGSDRGHTVVADSNLDWGQDGKRLAQWTHEHGLEGIAVHPFTWSDLYYYFNGRLIWVNENQTRDATTFLQGPGQQSNGWLAVSGHWLTSTHDGNKQRHYAWLDDYEPIAVIGNSIFVYHIQP